MVTTQRRDTSKAIALLDSIATVCLSGMLEEKIPAIAAAGFKGIELFENDVVMHDGYKEFGAANAPARSTMQTMELAPQTT